MTAGPRTRDHIDAGHGDATVPTAIGECLMPVVVLLAVLVAAGLLLVRLSDGQGVGDVPARVVTAATHRLPAHRREWGQAMVAELTQIRGRVRRWRFAAGVLRVALFLPPRHPRRVLAVAGIGLLVSAAANVVAAVKVPGLSVSPWRWPGWWPRWRSCSASGRCTRPRLSTIRTMCSRSCSR